MVYILIITYPYEMSTVLGVYSDFESAEIAKEDAEKADKSNGYNEFDIEEHEIK